ncbi:MAG: hypothetical protein LAT78_12200 [Roseinatronobacter sp.]|nr:hypothetical protein [Roseinatronobacter sp.]
MEPWLTQIRNTLLSDKTPRVFLLGTTAVLFLIVIIDLFGARARAPEVRETMRMVAAEAPAATVPSVYRVPRDLASARGGESPQTQVVQPADDLPMEAPESAMAEAEIEEDIPQETPVETVAETADDTASQAELADSQPQAQAEDMAEAEPSTVPAAMVAA